MALFYFVLLWDPFFCEGRAVARFGAFFFPAKSAKRAEPNQTGIPVGQKGSRRYGFFRVFYPYLFASHAISEDENFVDDFFLKCFPPPDSF